MITVLDQVMQNGSLINRIAALASTSRKSHAVKRSGRRSSRSDQSKL
jgi:hypothetical protein